MSHLEAQTPERWRKIKGALDAALEAPANQRTTVLERLLDDDPALLVDAEAYLGLAAEIGDFIESPAVSLSPGRAGDPMLGRRIGPYKLHRLLGRGGMGSVYLAVREDDYEKRVALKVLHRALSSDEMVGRFRKERQILARLEHPAIARLLDGGATAEGLPYLVMEYVEGERFDVYCDSRCLGVAPRLELFRQVCSAVHFAHRNLVVHRDLKPGNILVGDDGVPKLLDFGIAKLLGGESVTLLSGGEVGPMTYQYASPEQILGEPITTASDVYSLGVLLYEILTGHLPFRRGRYRHPLGVAKAIGTEQPPKPSTAVWRDEGKSGDDESRTTAESVSRTRGSDPLKLQRRLAGDVDAIVLKALRREPEHRYGTAEELSEDVRRHLEGLPVAARAGTLGYRAGKFVRRHRMALATAAVFAAMVVAFVVALAVQLDRTREERNRATMAMDLLVEFLESPELSDDEDVSVEKVVERGTNLFGAGFADDLEAQAYTLDSLGLVLIFRGSYDKAQTMLEGAVDRRRRRWGDDHPLVAESLHSLAFVCGLRGDPEKAERLARQALAIERRHYRAPHRLLAKGINNHAAQLLALERYDEAEPLYREVLRMKVELYGEVHLEVATAHANLGTLYYDRGDYEAALGSYRRALEIREKLLPPGHPKLGKSYSHMARVLLALGDYQEAASIFRRVVELRSAIQGREHPEVASALNNLAFVLERLGGFEEAEALYRRALRIRLQSFGEDHPAVATVRRNLASLLAARGDFVAAEEQARMALEVFSERQGSWRVADTRSVLGSCLAGQGRYDEAEPLLLESLAELREKKGAESLYALDARSRVADLYSWWGKAGQAAEYRP